MGTNRMADKSPNDVAKIWQVENVQKSIDNVVDQITHINDKLDNKYATTKDVDQKIELVHAHYGPMKKNLSRLLWVVLPIVMTLFLTQVWALINNVS